MTSNTKIYFLLAIRTLPLHTCISGWHLQTIYIPGTRKSPSLANRRLTILAAGSDIDSALFQCEECMCCPQDGSSTYSQSSVLINGRATLHNWRIIRTNFGDGLKNMELSFNLIKIQLQKATLLIYFQVPKVAP